jgi:hypothetical protein
VGKYIAPEEEWMRMLTLELTPVLNVMRGDDLPIGRFLQKLNPKDSESTPPLGRGCRHHPGACALLLDVCFPQACKKSASDLSAVQILQQLNCEKGGVGDPIVH